MRLEHINLVVKDIQQTLEFYQTAFPHWKVRTQGEDDWHGTKRKWIHFGDDYHYLTFNDNGTGTNRDLKSNHLGMAHFAYLTNNLDAVIERMKRAGVNISHNGAAHPHRKNVYFVDPNGYELEFVEYLSDLPKQRNSD